MKQQDVVLIIVIAFISGVASFFLSGVLFKGAGEEQKVSRIDAISTDFQTPDKKYFNSESVNPTPSIRIGDSNNTNPFSGGR